MNFILNNFFKLLFNLKILDFFLKIKFIISPWIKKSKGRIILSSINNKGEGCYIHGNSTIINPEKLILGDYVLIGEDSFIFAKGGVEIGDNTQISRNLLIYSSNHDVNGEMIPYDFNYIDKKVTIGKSVWIGMNVTIIPGVKIGDGAIIGMGSVVSKDVPTGAIIVSSEQKIIKYRNMERFSELENKNKLFGEKKYKILKDKNEF